MCGKELTLGILFVVIECQVDLSLLYWMKWHGCNLTVTVGIHHQYSVHVILPIQTLFLKLVKENGCCHTLNCVYLIIRCSTLWISAMQEQASNTIKLSNFDTPFPNNPNLNFISTTCQNFNDKTVTQRGYKFDSVWLPLAAHVVHHRGQLPVPLQQHPDPGIRGQLLDEGPSGISLGGHLYTDLVWDFLWGLRFIVWKKFLL